ncbi:MAG: pyruvate kinase [Erysipelotrichaceae bacterium]|nr:pyruvate kinase [Erysipelotrichaceae bacterium]
MRRTKIICTIGPASESEEMLIKLYEAGMNMARLNCSHGNHEEKLEKIKKIHKINKKLGAHIGIMLDTKGPEIRVGEMENGSVDFVKGDTVRVVKKKVVGNKERFHIDCAEMFKDVRAGKKILINDGKLSLAVKEKGKDELICEVLNSGPIATRKGVNLPGVVLTMPFVSEQDERDIRFGARNGVDFIAASFVRRASDVKEIKRILADEGRSDIEVIAKIENKEGYDNLNAILNVADGVMVARGDLGVEVSLQLVPLYQKHIIDIANKTGRPVITATHMLESMVSNPRPTRAEASDVANAVFDGSDCIMLSAETASGEYPVEAVQTMATIAEECERMYDYGDFLEKMISHSDRSMSDAIGISVAESCLTMHNVSAVLAFTETGGTAKRLSKYKPSAPIIAATNSEETCRRMSLYSDVYPVYSKDITDASLYDNTANHVVKQMNLARGSMYIICAGWHSGHGNTNTMRFATVGDNDE